MSTPNPRKRPRHNKDEILILLALLAVPECRIRAGYPPRGPLSLAQIARYIGMSHSGVSRIEKNALRKIKRSLAQLHEQ